VNRFAAASLAIFLLAAAAPKPLLVIQGAKDDAIPPNQGPALEKLAASHDKAFVPIAGAKHNGLLENPQSQAAIANFLRAESSTRAKTLSSPSSWLFARMCRS
jgi:pimeloyl-ACP methyl ester carboxylesterase